MRFWFVCFGLTLFLTFGVLDIVSVYCVNMARVTNILYLLVSIFPALTFA